jgi:hypothetical protein
MVFGRFYFLHIDKTIGRLTGLHLTDPLYQHIENSGISALELNNRHIDHNFWRDFHDDTYIFSTIRNPTFHYLSNFLYTVCYGDSQERDWGGGKDISCPYFTVDNLKKWMENTNRYNYQYKVFSQNNENLYEVFKKIDRVNFIIPTDTLRNKEIDCQNKIMKDLNIEKTFSLYNKDYEIEFYEETVLNFYHLHIANTDLEKEINKINKMDWEIYNYVQSKYSNF